MIADDFEKMIEDNKRSFTDDVYGLFMDSVKCFISSIYRPAYLLAYQAIMQHFRYLIQTSRKPDLYCEIKWNGILCKLRNDRTFDEEVYKCIQRSNQPSANPPVFAVLDMPDNIRKDFEFWKNRRNDCAHYKDFDINVSHVLAFYSFIIQYLFRISVEGLLVAKNETRNLWMVKIANNRKKCAILANLISTGLIDKEEIEEAISKTIYHYYSNNQVLGEISESEWTILKNNGFLNILQSNYFNKDFTSNNARILGKEKYNFFMGVLIKVQKEPEWIKILVSIFSELTYPNVWRDIFVEQCLSKPDYKLFFESVCNNNGLTIPSCLK